MDPEHVNSVLISFQEIILLRVCTYSLYFPSFLALFQDCLPPNSHNFLVDFNWNMHCIALLLTQLNYLKGEYEDYTWGYRQNPQDYPLPWVPITFSSVHPSFNNPHQIPNFSFFNRVENLPLKQRLKQNRRIILTNVRHIFSFA